MLFCYKSLLLLQITCNDDISSSCDLTLVGTYGVHTDKGSKVIKGSFPVKSLKIFKKSYLLRITRDDFRYKSCDLALIGTHVMVTD